MRQLELYLVELRCAKCQRPWATFGINREGAVYPMGKVVTDLEDEMRARQEGREHVREPWQLQPRFVHRCRCGRREQSIRLDTLERQLGSAVESGETAIYA